MQAMVAAFYVVTTLFAIVSILLLRSDLESRLRKIYAQNPPPNLTADQYVQVGLISATVGALVFGVIFLVIAALSAWRRWTWLFWANIALLTLIGLSNLGTGITSIVSPASSSSSVSPGQVVIAVVFGLVAVGLAVFMVVAAVQRGPWAQQKVPAAL